MPIAYSYVRFSSIEQRKGDSLRRQSELSYKYAQKHGLTLDTTLHLQDLGLSAFDRSNVERGALGAFLEAIKLGKIQPGSYLLVESLDRLSRAQVLHALEVFISILRQGITIVTLADEMVYSAESVGNNFANLIFSITIMARAHEESAMKSHRIRAAWTNKRAKINERKLTAQCPRWLRLADDKTKFELVPERVKLIMEILTLSKNGMGQAQIAKLFNERGILPFSKHGKGWHSSYVQKVITSTALYGEHQIHIWVNGKSVPTGESVPDYYPALITPEEFHLLQNLRSERRIAAAKGKKGTDVPNLLSGVVKCGYCGRTMIMATVSGRSTKQNTGIKHRPTTKILVCDGGRRGLGCYAVQWNYRDFEKSFLSFCRGLELKQLLDSVDSVESEKRRQLSLSEQLQAVVAEADEAQNRMQNLLRLAESGDAPTSILDRIRTYEDKLTELQSKKKRVEAELAVAQSVSRSGSDEHHRIGELIDRLGGLTGEKLLLIRSSLAERIRRVVEVVQVFPAGPLYTPQHVELIRRELIEEGYSPSKVDAHISANYQTEPKRQGRGSRGRYGLRKDSGRYFIIRAKNGGIRVAYPDFDDPTRLIVDMEHAGNKLHARPTA